MNNTWNDVLLSLKNEYDKESYDTWIELISFLGEDDNNFYICPGGSFINFQVVNNRYKDNIEKTYTTISGSNKKCILVKEEDITKTNIPNSNNKKTKKENKNYMNLNPDYLFDDFVVGSKNQFAHAACVAVAQKPGKDFNPLFLYGGVGLGKTHLMHAIGNYIKNNDNDKKIMYVTSENFTNDFINSIKNQKQEEFRKKYRSIDVLLVDDIQFFSNKKETQEEFFHTFNELKESNKHVIITSDRPPKDIGALADRLKSRFSQGLVADIGSPDYETRVAILKKKADKEVKKIDEEVFNYIATNVKSNIRDLEGCLNRIIAYSDLCNIDSTNEYIDLDFAKSVLSEFIDEKSTKVIDHNYIINTVCDYFDVKIKDIFSNKRTKTISYPRQVSMYLIRNMTDLSLPKIGEIFERDHSTVIHAYDKISAEMEENETTKNTIDSIVEKINS